MHPQDHITYSCYGGSIDSDTLHNVVIDGYLHTKNEVNGYKKDDELSGKRVQVYYHPDKSHLLINYRGTDDLNDVYTDLRMFFGDKSGRRFSHGKEVTDKAIDKYAEYQPNVTLIGHSLGHQIGKEANKHRKEEMISVNPAILPADLLDKQDEKNTIVRTKLDPVSALHFFQPYKRDENTVTIGSTSYNPIAEHSSETLERLKDKQIGV